MTVYNRAKSEKQLGFLIWPECPRGGDWRHWSELGFFSTIRIPKNMNYGSQKPTEINYDVRFKSNPYS